MEELIAQVLDIISDYRNHDAIQLTEADIRDWANQFGEEAAFVLEELVHILPEVYFSRERARAEIKLQFRTLAGKLQYKNLPSFLEDTLFLDTQVAGKSQGALLALLEEVLQQDYEGQSYIRYKDSPKRNFIYFDDVLASGGTVGKDLIAWLKQKQEDADSTNFERVMNGEYRLAAAFLCIHTWGLSLLQQLLNHSFGTNKLSERIIWCSSYQIENHLQRAGQRLNAALPVFTEEQSRAHLYLGSLLSQANKFVNYAYRHRNYPANETFFTSPDNRIHYEHLLLEKGLDIIEMIQGEVRPNIRPLGFIYPNYFTFGLGTHFFSWRKVPNNCPLVFWWEVDGHNWKPLFPVKRAN